MTDAPLPPEDDPQRLGEPGATTPRGRDEAESDLPDPSDQPTGDPDRPSNPS
jgi:hypothetical protein